MAIEILPTDVVNQIAAGEVLDRPANLVKELVENSLDAGATDIEVSFEDRGRRLTIIDNGEGMNEEDLKLCLARHATSKIRRTLDLFRLKSYGFRGEALASAAGVSEMEIVSRTSNTPAKKLIARFGQVDHVLPAEAKVGTEIRVRELFANVPARLEFLKSEASEFAQIRTTLKALALAREDVQFRIRSGGSLVFHWPAQSFLDRSREVLQKAELFYGQGERNGIQVEVAVGSPQDTQAANRNFWFFVQGRWVQDRGLVAAVLEGYRSLLMHGEYPAAVIRITLPPDEVDVNVHPTKSGVKFKNSQDVFRAVCYTVRSVLEKGPWLENLAPKVNIADGKGSETENSDHSSSQPSFQGHEFSQVQYSKKVFPLAEVKASVATYQGSRPTLSPPTSFSWRDLQIIGQAHLTYILAQSSEIFFLVDQHAAHERVLYERLKRSLELGQMEVQQLLLPLSVDLSADEVESVLGERAQFERMGIQIEPMGPSTIVVRTIPSLVQETAVIESLKKAANQKLASSVAQDTLATMACHSAVRAGQALSPTQMRELLVQMDEFPLSSFCPHGRPVYVQRRFSEIDREFGRIV